LGKPIAVHRNKVALGFLDLIEIKFVDAFLNVGVTWPIIHKVREKAQNLYIETNHPFCTQQFVTDGRQIFRDLHEEPAKIVLKKLQPINVFLLKSQAISQTIGVPRRNNT